jgi:elongation factor Ts
MPNITLDEIKKLHKQAGVGIGEAKKALEAAKGDIQKAMDHLRKQGAKIAAKKAAREAHEGIIEAYIHGNGKIGVILELNCETDFVAKNKEFKNLAHDLAMHIAANNPQYVNPEDMDGKELAKETEIFKEQMKKQKKPAKIVEKILKGKIEKLKAEEALLSQQFLKNDKITVKQRIEETIGKVGENIKVNRFVRYKI